MSVHVLTTHTIAATGCGNTAYANLGYWSAAVKYPSAEVPSPGPTAIVWREWDNNACSGLGMYVLGY